MHRFSRYFPIVPVCLLAFLLTPVRAKADQLTYVLTATNTSGVVAATGSFQITGPIAAYGVSTFTTALAKSGGGGGGCSYDCIGNQGTSGGTVSGGASGPMGGASSNANYAGSVDSFKLVFPDTPLSENFNDGNATDDILITFTNGILTEIDYNGRFGSGNQLLTGSNTMLGGLHYVFNKSGQAVSRGVLSAVIAAPDPISSDPTTPDPTAPTPSAVTPEPSSLVLLGTGLLGVAGVARRRFSGLSGSAN